MLDVFNRQITLDDILEKDLWFLQELFDARIRFLEEKRKAESEAHKKAEAEAKIKNKQISKRKR